MEQITILNTAYIIYLETGKTDIEFIDELTGLSTRLYLLSIFIEPRNKHIQTIWRKQVLANNIVVTEESFTNTTSENDFLDFEASLLGAMIKRSSINGVFRFNLKNSLRVYDDQGQLIIEQPVAFPEPVQEEILIVENPIDN